MFRFHHYASQRLRSRISQDNAPAFAKRRLSVRKSAGDFGQRVQRWFGANLYVDDGLRIVLEAGYEFRERAMHGNQRCNFYGGEEAITGGTVVQKNNVAGLLASQNATAA